MQEFLGRVAGFEVLAVDTEAAVLAGRIEADVARTGKPVGRADATIAAVALAHGLPLVTGNTEHYARIRDLGHALVLRTWRGD